MLSSDDRAWLEGKFSSINDRIDTVHSRITEHAADDAEQLGQIRESMATHNATPCHDVQTHLKEKHNPVRFWGIVSGIVALLALVVEAIRWVSHGGRP